MADIDIVFNVKDAGAVSKVETLKKSIAGTSSIAGGATKAFTGMFGSILAGNLVTQAVTKTLNTMKTAVISVVEAAIESQKVEAQLEAVLRSTGYAAGMTKDQLIGLAKGLQGVTTFSDEAIIGAENILLTFTNIGKNIFPEATEAVMNMSTALGQDLKSSAIQLGKALQDPILGVTALRRVGVNFNEAQTKVIKKLVETGRAAEAQRMILKELATEFGGSAQAAAKTFGGRLAQIKNQINEMKESFGNFIVQNKDLVLALEGVVVVLKKMIGTIESGKGVFGAVMNSMFGTTIAYLKGWAMEERARQAVAERGKKQAEEIIAAFSKEGASLKILGINIIDVAKKFLRLATGSKDAAGALMTLDQITEKFKIQTKTELTIALREAEQAMKTLKASTEKTPGAIIALQKVIDDLKESLYGKQEKTIFDMIMEARRNPKYLEPIPISIVVTTEGGDLPVLYESRKKLLQKALEFLNPPKKLAFDWKGVADDISRYWQDGIANMIAGTSSFRDFVSNSFKTMAAGVGSALGKLAGSALKSLGGIAGPIGSVIGGLATAAISGLGKLFGIKSKAEKEREKAAKAEAELKRQTEAVMRSYKQLGDVSEQTARSIAEATKTMGKARAEAKFLGDIIRDVGINTSNWNALWAKAMSVLASTRRGTIPAREAIESLNKAFDALISGARDLGREFGQNVARFMMQLRESGLRVGAALEYMRGQLSRIPDAFKKLTTGAQLTSDRLADMGTIAKASFAALIGSGTDFLTAIGSMREGLVQLKDRFGQMGETADDSLRQLFKISDVAAANAELFDAISANKDIIEALGNSGWMTNDAMASLSRNAVDFYTKLQTAGMTSEESLRAMGPTLQRLYDYAKAYGLQVDANTQAIIDQAKALGIVKDTESAQEAALDRVFGKFGDRLEGIMDKFARRLETAFGVGGGGYTETSSASGRGYASGGIAWYPQQARIAEREPEAIIPLSKIAAAIAASSASGASGSRKSGPMIFNLQIAGRTFARLIAPDLETLQRQGRYRSDIASVIRNET